MSLKNFKELLIKKTDGDLSTFIEYLKDDVLMGKTVEALVKMARKGDFANAAIRHFATEMSEDFEPEMMHDALSHHASQYKAALKEGNKALASRHMSQIYKISELASQVQTHAGDKLQFDAVSPHAWERNKYTNKYDGDHKKVLDGTYKEGEFVTKTRGWKYKGKDFDFLQQAPHDSKTNEVRGHGHNGAYPLEHMKVNGRYIHVDDNADTSDGYKSHEFDHHPIMSHFHEPAKHRTPEKDQQYVDQNTHYQDSEHVNSFFDRHEAMAEKDPNAYASRGSKVSDPVHDDVHHKLDISEVVPRDINERATAVRAKNKQTTDDGIHYSNKSAHKLDMIEPHTRHVYQGQHLDDISESLIQNFNKAVKKDK